MGTIKQNMAVKKMMEMTKPEKGESKKHEKTESVKVEKTEDKKVMTKSQAAKKAVAGKDMGKPGKNFSKIAASASKEYGSAAAGKRVAGAIFQKMRAKGKL